MNTRRLILGALSIGFCSLPAVAADWPQWRGPNRDGISQETGLLKEWPKTGPKLVWHLKEIGQGYSTPSVVAQRLYVMSNKGMDDESVRALDVTNGKEVWSRRVGRVGENQGPQYPGARSTPTIDGDVLYALGSDGDLACVDLASGEIRWSKSLRSDFGGEPGKWAYAESPLVDGDAVVCTPGGSHATLVALNKKSGAPIWKCEISGGEQAAYSSIIIAEAGGIKQYVQFLQRGLVGVDAKTGKVLWRYDRTAQGSPANIPTAVAHGNYVYSSTGRGGGGLVELKAHGESIKAEQIYYSPKLPTSIGGSVELNGFLYGTNSQGLMCAEFKTGAMKWQKRGVGAGSICYADGRFYVHGEKGAGEVALVEATSENYVEKGRFKPANPPERRKGDAWAYPVVANGRLYVRDAGSLWCYDVLGQLAAK